MADADSDAEGASSRRERAMRFVDGYLAKHRELFDKLARE